MSLTYTPASAAPWRSDRTERYGPGANENGQLGIGTTTNVNAPVQVAGLSGIKAISGGLGYHGMVLTENGSVWTWENDNGELGNGTRIQQNAPVLVNGLSDVMAIAAGDTTVLH